MQEPMVNVLDIAPLGSGMLQLRREHQSCRTMQLLSSPLKALWVVIANDAEAAAAAAAAEVGES